jgi:hypothetical protein
MVTSGNAAQAECECVQSASNRLDLRQGMWRLAGEHFQSLHGEVAMALKRIRLELARTPAFPNGSSNHGYEFVAPLDEGGHLDREEWHQYRQTCSVRRFWGDQEDEVGLLIHRRDGQWVFSYEQGEEDDEPIFKFDRHVFQVGEYVTVTEHDGQARPFKVVAIGNPAAPRLRATS